MTNPTPASGGPPTGADTAEFFDWFKARGWVTANGERVMVGYHDLESWRAQIIAAALSDDVAVLEAAAQIIDAKYACIGGYENLARRIRALRSASGGPEGSQDSGKAT